MKLELKVWGAQKSADIVDKIVMRFWPPFARDDVDGPLAVRMDVRNSDVVL